MRLDVLTMEQCERVPIWRNECPETLRTPYPLTKEQQDDFYRQTVCNPTSPHRYWAILVDPTGTVCAEVPVPTGFVGMGGLTYIQWENRIAEISLILDPAWRGKGFGEQAVDLLLEQAFDRMGLKTVCGEVYGCNLLGWAFWKSIAKRYCDENYCERIATLPNRKFWAGVFYDSMYFSVDVDDWRRVHGKSG